MSGAMLDTHCMMGKCSSTGKPTATMPKNDKQEAWATALRGYNLLESPELQAW